MKHSIFLIFIISTIIYSCSSSINESSKSNQNTWSDSLRLSPKEKKQKKIWDNFKSAVIKKDSSMIRNLSLNCIYCSTCNENSTKEYEKLNKLQASNPDEYFKIRDENYIPIYTFIKDDLSYFINDFTLDDNNIEYISERKETNFDLDSNCVGNLKPLPPFLEVSISDKSCTGEECSQTIFSFAHTENGYKFCGFIQIP